MEVDLKITINLIGSKDQLQKKNKNKVGVEMATNFIYITKLSIARQTSKINLRITSLDQFQKPIGIQNQISIQNLGKKNFFFFVLKHNK